MKLICSIQAYGYNLHLSKDSNTYILDICLVLSGEEGVFGGIII